MTQSGWRNGPAPVDAAARRAFLDERRESHARRMSELAPRYDGEWGALPPTHRRFVGRLLDLARPHGTVLDVACGTGRIWPLILDSGRTLVGVDQSAGMLRVAAAKHPTVPVGLVGFRELAFDAVFDAVTCVDALENVGPEDWPETLRRLRDAARPGAPLYITVEVAAEEEVRAAYEQARAAGEPVVPGDDFDGVGYHYYPTREAVDGWLEEAGLELVADEEGDWYRHLLVVRPA